MAKISKDPITEYFIANKLKSRKSHHMNQIYLLTKNRLKLRFILNLLNISLLLNYTINVKFKNTVNSCSRKFHQILINRSLYQKHNLKIIYLM